MPIVDLDRHDPEHARELLAQAEARLAEKDRAAAVTALEAAMRHDAFDEEPPLLAAMIRFQDQQLARSVSLALDSIRIRPFHPAAMHLVGVALLDAGHAGVAQEVLRAVVRMAPGMRKAKQNLKRAQRAGRRADESRIEMPLAAVRELLSGQSSRLGAVVVVREADSDLSRSIESIESVADEILVVDATVQGGLCRSASDPWRLSRFVPADGEDDPSALLNASIRLVSSDWVLVLDAHERLTDPIPACALQDRDALYHTAEVRYPDGGSRSEIRLMRNAPGLRYTGSVEPRLDPGLADLGGRWRLGRGKARFTLESARPQTYWDRPADPRDVERRIELALAHLPEDAEPRIQLARLRIARGTMQPALEALAEARVAAAAGPRRSDDPERIATLEGLALLRLERFDELSRMIRNYHGTHSATRNTLFLEGFAARATGHPAQAVAALQRSLHWQEHASAVPPYPEVLGSGLSTMLGAALMDLGKLEDAKDAFEESLEREPGCIEARIGLLGLCLAAGETHELLRGMDDLAREHGDRPRAWSLGANVIGRVPQLASTTERWMEEACRRFPRNVELRRRLGEARLRAGHAAEALEAWEGLSETTPEETAARFAAALAAGAALPEIPAGARESVEPAVHGWLRLWMDWSAYEVLDRALLRIVDTAAWLPGLAPRTARWLHEIGQDEAAERLQGVLQ